MVQLTLGAGMGMFDNIDCDMPLPAGAEKVREWQTKCLDCAMTHYAIRKDGRLVNANIRNDLKPGAPKSPPIGTNEWREWRKNWWERKVGPDEPVNFTGSVNFYGTDEAGDWWEFCAFIERGRCAKIIRIEESN